ncbi:MAG TPA: 2-hydroxyacyl-CoA dehydratase, partial [Clostridiales bacterium]|nr:2-hydroxyacyl-CoA dehydratase [Clostridiales bacterium]
VVDMGLKYVHNDTCYPALLVIGQLLEALKSGKYDLEKTSVLITQTGGGCRASNYIHLLRKALKKADLAHIPVISLNLSGLEKNSGFKITAGIGLKMLAALIYGDLLMLLRNQVAPYEVKKGAADEMVEYWIDKLNKDFDRNRGFLFTQMKRRLPKITKDFAGIEVNKVQKTKVGIVGEIYVKYAALGNNGLERFLATQDCEYMVPGLMGFILFKTDNRLEDIKLFGGSKAKLAVMKVVMWYMTLIEKALLDAAGAYGDFVVPAPYEHQKSLVSGFLGLGTKMGEGWLLTAEMMELIESGYPNIVCTQPFGCLPNHIVGKGMIKKIREIKPHANIVPIDYDPGATPVNQENRIRLMLAVARENEAKEKLQAQANA